MKSGVGGGGGSSSRAAAERRRRRSRWTHHEVKSMILKLYTTTCGNTAEHIPTLQHKQYLCLSVEYDREK